MPSTSTAHQRVTVFRISVLAFIFGIIGLIMLLSASAAVDVRFTLSTDASVIVPDEEIVVDLDIDTVSSTVYALETTLSYDPSVLEFVDVSTPGIYAAVLNRVGGELNNQGEVKHPDVPVGEINIVRATPDDPIQGTAQIVQVTFRAITDSAVASALSISEDDTYVLQPDSDDNIFEGSNSLAITVDGVDPTVSITSPLQGSVVNGVSQFTVNATDNHALESVELLIDNQVVETFDTEPYTVAIDTTQLTDGDHVVFARATDVAGNSAGETSDSIPFVVDNTAPDIGATTPSENDDVEGTVTLSASVAEAGNAVEVVTFYIDNVEVGSDSVAPFEVEWDSTSVDDGTHVMRVETLDRVGNVSSPVSVSFTVTNDTVSVPVSVVILSPENGDAVSGDVAVSVVIAEFSEQTVPVTLLADGEVVGTDDSFPYAFLWDSSTADGSSVVLRAQAPNGSQLIQSSPVTVTVSNTINSDINEDGVVGLEDLSILVFNWQRTSGFGRSDINRDGIVNIFDLSRLLANWDFTTSSN